MGVFLNENAAARSSRHTNQQGKCSKSANTIFFAKKNAPPANDRIYDKTSEAQQ